ncbi:MAG TPA: hypothetical protein VKB36_12415 [Vicinamibacterales bacterium]|nr:hypothetical protein [Vicinamibacterales bacterium]
MTRTADVDTAKWSGEGTFTQLLVDQLKEVDGLTLVRVEDAPASRSEADYNFISNEIFVVFDTIAIRQRFRRFGLFPAERTLTQPKLNVAGLEAVLTSLPSIGAPDYSDESMLQYLRTERIVPPYQTKGYKLVELVRIYVAGAGGPR